MTSQLLRCAVYTRKSTEEGLDQDFNSIDSQREACFAYITSQKSEGWRAHKESYDDGGFSGGNMDRPALQKLLKDIKAKKIDTIVVYKIDRLTRSLMDFAKLIDLFDAYKVTFVSITQSFNTTTSMGRLTMNILLSFAQFEREITAERIRDKFSASKKKGIWMGGTTPTGYDVKDRRLIPNAEASFIRMVYERYLELGTIVNVSRDFKRRGIKSPLRTRVNGVQAGGFTFTTGALRHILMNPVYIGKIKHKTALYDGLHPPILPMELWQKVQERLISQSLQTRREKNYAADPCLFQGKLFDTKGNRYIPAYASGKSKKYKYYLVEKSRNKDPNRIGRNVDRLPAAEIESHAYKALQEHLSDPARLSKILMADPEKNKNALEYIARNSQRLTHAGSAINKVIVDILQYTLEIQVSKLCQYVDDALETRISEASEDTVCKLIVPFSPVSATRGTICIEPSGSEGDIELLFDLPEKEIKNLVRGVAWREAYFRGKSVSQIAAKDGVSRGMVDKLILESFRKI